MLIYSNIVWIPGSCGGGVSIEGKERRICWKEETPSKYFSFYFQDKVWDSKTKHNHPTTILTDITNSIRFLSSQTKKTKLWKSSNEENISF